MRIDEIHEFINFMIDKEINSYVSPADIDLALDRASMWRFNECVPFYAINQRAQDDLGPFKKPYTFTNGTSPNGLITLPSDYLYFLAAWFIGYDNDLEDVIIEKIEVINDDELTERRKSALRPVTAIKPVAQWAGKGKIQLYPMNASSGTVWYLKRPDAPNFSYTQTGRVIDYSDNSSTQLEWDEANTNKIMIKALQFLGVNISDEKIIEYTQIKDQERV